MSNAGGGPNIDGVNAIAHDTVIKHTGLIPDTKYLVTVKAENKLYGMDNTTSRSESISVTLLEGGMLHNWYDNRQPRIPCKERDASITVIKQRTQYLCNT